MPNDEIVKEEEVNTESNSNIDYIETIKKIKESTVDKEDYNKLRDENKKLLDTLASGGSLNDESKADTPKKSIQELRNELFTGDHSNLDFIQRTLELRDRIMEDGGTDPFLPNGLQISADGDDVMKANNVAEALRHCVEYAEGDSQLFTNELQRITRDVMPKRGR